TVGVKPGFVRTKRQNRRHPRGIKSHPRNQKKARISVLFSTKSVLTDGRNPPMVGEIAFGGEIPLRGV
ncbi:MAG: hypothetical protein J5852_08885, partial [Clostridia bacterium]|nr:hypothetical protein [Clostridia bacterium]